MDQTNISEKDILKVIETNLGTVKFQVISTTFIPVEERIGLLGDHAILNVTVLDQNKKQEIHLNFFLKLFPKLKTMAGFARGSGAFQREEFIYETFSKFSTLGISSIKKCTPNCYLYKPTEYLIFDNLVAEGFKMPPIDEYFDYNTILVVLQSLAQLHASSIIYEERMSKELGKTFRIIDGNENNFQDTLYDDSENFRNKNAIEATFNCILSEISFFKFSEKLSSGKQFSEIFKRLYPKIFLLVKPSDKYRNIICHGDLWSSNILLKNNEKEETTFCKFVDFQSARYVPPSHDVLSVIYLTTSRQFREEFLYELIGIYYSYLEKTLKTSGYILKKFIPFSEFMDSCEEQKTFAVLLSAGILPLILSDRSVLDHYFSDETLYNQVFRGDRSCLVYENVKNELYLKRLRDSIEDLKYECEKFR